jgi:hypothetical protein
MVTPASKQWDAVIYLSILPEPSTCLSASPRLKTPEKRCFVTRRIPEFPCDHTDAVPVRVLVGAGVPPINMPAKASFYRQFTSPFRRVLAKAIVQIDLGAQYVFP